MNNILVLYAPWTFDLFKSYTDELKRNYSINVIDYFTYFENKSDSIYEQISDQNHDNQNKLFSDNEIDDIILRCRYLRIIKKNKAINLVKSVSTAINNILVKKNYNLILCEAIDNYIYDILFRLAEKRDINSISYIHSFVNGYVRISSRGEHLRLRNVSEEEIKEVKDLLSVKNYTPTNLVDIKNNLLKRYIKVYFSNILRIIYYEFKSLFYKFNYHYLSSSKCFRTEFLHLVPKFNIANKKGDLNDIILDDRTKILIPLQHIPEATIDYWTENNKFVDYYGTIFRLIEKYQHQILFIFKEHPGVYGYRKPSFFKSLEKYDVAVLDISQPSSDLFDIVDGVLAWTSTFAVEASLKGVPSILMTKNYYSKENTNFMFYEESMKSKDLIDFLNQKKNVDYSNEIIEYILSANINGYLRSNGTFNKNNKQHLNELKMLVSNSIEYLNKKLY